MAPMESGPSGDGGQHGSSGQNRPCTSHNSQRPQQQQQHSTAQPIADTRSGWLDRHRGCESLTSTMATRPTAAAVTVPGRENNDPGGERAIRAGKLVFLKDQLAVALFLADTGAGVSLIPGPPSSGGQALTAANSATHHHQCGAESLAVLPRQQFPLTLVQLRLHSGQCGWAHLRY